MWIPTTAMEDCGAGATNAVYEALVPAGTSGGVSITPNAAAHTKGDWVEIGISTIPCDGFFVQANAGEVADDYLFDIGIGGTGVEVVIVQDILISAMPGTTGFGDPVGFYIPLPQMSATRFSVRTQCSQASAAALSVNMILANGGSYEAMRRNRATTYGANTGTTRGTSIDPGGSANADGTWVQISGAISNPIEAVLLCYGNQQNTARTTASWRTDLGFGASLSEVVVVPQTQLRAVDSTDMVRPLVAEREAAIAAGERLVARARCSITDATDRLFDLVVIGFD